MTADVTTKPTPAIAAADTASLPANTLFLVWGPPGHGPRSRVFAAALGIDVEFVYSTRRRGLAAAVAKYAYQTVATLRLLRRRRPDVVFVQSPPSIAVLVVAAFCAVTGSSFIVDAHSDALLSPWWTRPRWLYRLVARRAVATIVTNEHFAAALERTGATALVVRDVPAQFSAAPVTLPPGEHVTVVSTFASDEPLDAVMAAAADLPMVQFHVTGDTRRAPRAMVLGRPENVRLTGFLPDDEYYGLLAASSVVVCLTTRDHTMQRGACEATSLGVPVVTSNWPLLREYFAKGAVHVDNTAPGIRQGLIAALRDRPTLARELGAVQQERRREWQAGKDVLVDLVSARRAP